jgi:hypothetical protein
MPSCRILVERFLGNQFERVGHRFPPLQRQPTTETAFTAHGGRESGG